MQEDDEVKPDFQYGLDEAALQAELNANPASATEPPAEAPVNAPATFRRTSSDSDSTASSTSGDGVLVSMPWLFAQ